MAYRLLLIVKKIICKNNLKQSIVQILVVVANTKKKYKNILGLKRRKVS